MSACGPQCGWCGACTSAWEDDDYDDGRCPDCGAGADEHCTDDCCCDDCNGIEDEQPEGVV